MDGRREWRLRMRKAGLTGNFSVNQQTSKSCRSWARNLGRLTSMMDLSSRVSSLSSGKASCRGRRERDEKNSSEKPNEGQNKTREMGNETGAHNTECLYNMVIYTHVSRMRNMPYTIATGKKGEKISAEKSKKVSGNF